MEIYLIVSPPYNLLESRRSYFTKPYFCDVPRNIRLPLWRDHEIAGPIFAEKCIGSLLFDNCFTCFVEVLL
jgi:hypothetical protein